MALEQHWLLLAIVPLEVASAAHSDHPAARMALPAASVPTEDPAAAVTSVSHEW
jgi:hypothetical protein